MTAMEGAKTMNDLIKREDAIEAVCRTRCGDKAKGCPAHSCLVIEEFDALLSAEAVDVHKAHEEEHLNIVNRIKELQYAIAKTQTIVGKMVESAEAVQGEWRTGKPTENGEYMVTLDAWGHRYIDVMHYAKPQMPNREVDGTCWYRYDDEWGDVVYDDSDILAWMPLPTPYKGGDSE